MHAIGCRKGHVAIFHWTGLAINQSRALLRKVGPGTVCTRLTGDHGHVGQVSRVQEAKDFMAYFGQHVAQQSLFFFHGCVGVVHEDTACGCEIFVDRQRGFIKQHGTSRTVLVVKQRFHNNNALMAVDGFVLWLEMR